MGFMGGLLLLVMVLPIAASADGIKWYTYEKGMAAGKEEGKKIFLHFYADWCRYCKQMDSKAFSDNAIVGYLNSNFIPIRVNSDKQSKIAMKYRVRGLPTTWFLRENGDKIVWRPGYIGEDDLLGYLKFIQTDSYKHMSLKDFLKQSK